MKEIKLNNNIINFHNSIYEELNSLKNRIRDIIGLDHLPSDGNLKELIIRKWLKNHIPSKYSVCHGFIVFKDGSHSGQQDILIIDNDYPIFYNENDFVVVTPECVKAVIEVKTTLKTAEMNKIPSDKTSRILKFDMIKEIRSKTKCWFGFYSFENHEGNVENLLTKIQEFSSKEEKKAVNCIACGSNQFIRFWETHELENVPNKDNNLHSAPYWHYYEFKENTEKFAPSYFMGNLIDFLAKENADSNTSLWYPMSHIVEGGTKEIRRKAYIDLSNRNAFKHFN